MVEKIREKQSVRKRGKTMDQRNDSVKNIVVVAFFAAVTYLGIQVFRIPIPAAVGTPFLHFGNIFVVLGILFLGGRRGAVSGTLGLLIFDLLNGYIHAMPKIFIVTILKCLVLGWLFSYLNRKHSQGKHAEYRNAVVVTAAYVLLTLLLEFVAGTIELLIAGSVFQGAVAASFSSLPATAINGIFTLVGVGAAYLPLRRALKKVL